ncbi:MAG: antiviral reverse transcriptase Drt2 [Lentisphaeria bacterium]
MPTSSSDKPQWYRQRRYLHFDRPVGVKRATHIVESPKAVARHAFYPLINYQIVSKKVRRTRDGKELEYKEKTRDISYAAHADSHIYSYYSAILNEKYEQLLQTNEISGCVLAFRSLGLSNIEFAASAFEEIARRKQCAAVALDVSGFFDNLDHEMLKLEWCRLLDVARLPEDHFNVFRSLTKFSKVNREKLYDTFNISPSNPKHERNRVCKPDEFRTLVRDAGLIQTNKKKCGIPQGSPISAILSNIYMVNFDLRMNEYAKSVDGVYLRYCDDILLIVPIEERDKCAGVAAKSISNLKLRLNTEKTVRITFTRDSGVLRSKKPLQYLGFTFDGQQILIRSAAFSRYSNHMKRGVRLAKATSRRWNKVRAKRGADEKKLYRRKLYKRYSYLGRRNFITYGYRAARIMDSPAIRGQLRPLWRRLLDEIEDHEM